MKYLNTAGFNSHSIENRKTKNNYKIESKNNKLPAINITSETNKTSQDDIGKVNKGNINDEDYETVEFVDDNGELKNEAKRLRKMNIFKTYTEKSTMQNIILKRKGMTFVGNSNEINVTQYRRELTKLRIKYGVPESYIIDALNQFKVLKMLNPDKKPSDNVLLLKTAGKFLVKYSCLIRISEEIYSFIQAYP